MAELQGLGAALSEAEKTGVQILAISPDPNEQSQHLAERLRLGYRFVSDPGLAVTRRYGLIHAGGGPKGEDVPRPATAVIDRDGVLRWLWVADNFQVRPDPREVVRAVRLLDVRPRAERLTMTGRELIVARLTTAPNLLREIARDAGEAAWTPPKPGEWSIAEVVRHLVEGDRDTFVPRLRRMVAESRPVFDKTPRTEGDHADLTTLLDAFASARRQAVTLLGRLDDAGWRREGVSPSRGALSVETYAATMDAHDTEHLRQIQDVRATLGLVPKRCEARLGLPLSELMPALLTTPQRVADLAAGLEARVLRERPAPGEWSMKEVLAHLMELDSRLFLPRFRMMATEDGPRFEAFDPEAWGRERDRREGRFEDDLEAFRRARAEVLAFLATLPRGAAERPGFSGFFGPLTLAQYATHMADHDLDHLAQLRACRAVVGSELSRCLRRGER